MSGFTPHRNYVATLPCKTENAIFIILPLQLLQKLTSKFIQFLTQCNSYYLTRITITYL